VLTARPSPGVAIALLQGFAVAPAVGRVPGAGCDCAPAAETMPRASIADSRLLERRMRPIRLNDDWYTLPFGKASAKHGEAADEQRDSAADGCRIDFRCREMGASSGRRY
jgi:hypothetical protein